MNRFFCYLYASYQRMRDVMCLLFLCAAVLCGSQAAWADSVDDARQQMRDGHDTQAASLLESWARSHANDYEALFMLGMVYAQQEKYGKAIEMFHQVSALRPELAEPHSNLALIYHTMGDNRAAVKELELFLHKKPGDAVIHENLGDLHVKLALRNYKAALARDPSRELHDKYQQLLQLGQLSPVVADHVVGSDKVSGPIVAPEVTSVKTRIAIADTPPIETVTEDAPVVATDTSKLIWDNPAASLNTEDKKETPVTSGVSIASDSLKTPVYIHTGNQPEGVQVIGNTPVDKAVLDAVEAWRLAWSTQNISDYFSIYAEGFIPFYQNTRQTLDAWKQYKKRVIFEKLYIHVVLSHLSIEMLDHGDRARVQFEQNFDSNSYHSQDDKELIFIKQSNDWKIIQERIIKKDMVVSAVEQPTVEQPTVEQPTVEQPTVEQPTVEQEVLNVVEAWRSAWAAKDIQSYFHAYADNFAPSEKSQTLKSWKQYKKRVISEKKRIQIVLRDLHVKVSKEEMRAIIQFQQVFDSDNYTSRDDKELILVKQAGGWKILQEKVL